MSVEGPVESDAEADLSESSVGVIPTANPQLEVAQLLDGDPEDVVSLNSSDSGDDFRQHPQKRRKVEIQQESDTRDNNGLNTSTEDGQTCSICFEPWSNSGAHRLASLRCGHLFGHGCIDKWLKGQGSKCPQCNAKAKRSDLRVIYAKSLSVVDTSEKDRALQELEEEKKSRILAQKSEAQAIVQYQLSRVECDRLQQRVLDLEERFKLQGSSSSSGPTLTALSSSQDQPTAAVAGQYVGMKNISVAQHGDARVAAFDAAAEMLVVSRPSNNRLLPGHGLLKISGLELRASEFVAIHSGVLRDAVFSPAGEGLVLTASLDKTLKMTSMASNTVVQSYALPGPGWSCAWDRDQPALMYCGLHNGSVVVFDQRNTAGHLHLHRLPKPCPVTSLAFVPRNRSVGLLNGGLLAGTLEGVMFCEKEDDSRLKSHSLVHSLPEGACTSLSYEERTNHCMVSFRPSRLTPHSRHLVGQLVQSSPAVPGGEELSLPVVHQFQGSPAKLLSRSLLFPKPGVGPGELLASFGNEGKKTAQIYDCSKGELAQELSGNGQPVLDILPFSVNSSPFISLLTANKLLVYKWT